MEARERERNAKLQAVVQAALLLGACASGYRMMVDVGSNVEAPETPNWRINTDSLGFC